VTPAIINPCGYDFRPGLRRRWGRLWTVPTYEFRLAPDAPITFFDGLHYWQPDRHFHCDGASIPPPLHGLPGYHPYQALGFVWHDSGYIHGGLWRSAGGDVPYAFIPLGRDSVDDMMYRIDRADGLRWGAAHARYRAVRAFGGGPWSRYRAADAR
jgi:hypothetical protein